MIRDRATASISAYFVATVCFLLLGISMMSACTSSQRKDTLHASVLAVNAARDRFVDWDLTHQQALKDGATSRDDAQKKIATYRTTTQTEVLGWFTTVYQALAIAATQTDDPSLSAALAASSGVIDSIQKLLGGK